MPDPMRDSTTDSTSSVLGAAAARLRRGALWVIFALVLLIPKTIRLRRRRRTWNIIRVLAAFAGAGMLVLGAARGYDATPIVAGAILLLLALLVRAARTERAPGFSPASSVDARARELGALIAVDGGRYIDGGGRPHRAKLFVGPDQLWVLDAALHVLLEIPMPQIRMLVAEPSGEDWRFRVHCENSTAEFIYKGSFAQHLAGVADATIRSRLNRELPVLR
jgi:hypothetical protein